MSEPTIKETLHDAVEKYAKRQGERVEIMTAEQLHEEIDNIDKRTEVFEVFLEWATEQ